MASFHRPPYLKGTSNTWTLILKKAFPSNMGAFMGLIMRIGMCLFNSVHQSWFCFLKEVRGGGKRRWEELHVGPLLRNTPISPKSILINAFANCCGSTQTPQSTIVVFSLVWHNFFRPLLLILLLFFHPKTNASWACVFYWMHGLDCVPRKHVIGPF